VKIARNKSLKLIRAAVAYSLISSALLFNSAALAHEVWLAPQTYHGERQTPVQADIRLGQNFIGDALRYRPRTIAKLAFLTRTAKIPVTGRVGDLPAIQTAAPIDGQNIIIYQSLPEKMLYKNFNKFADFVQEKGDENLLDQHFQRNLPEMYFTEIYSRFAKTILLRGDAGKGIQDRMAGLEVEFVLEGDLMKTDSPLPIRLYYQSEPLANAKITIFDRGRDRKTSQQKTFSDRDGYIYLTPLKGHEYLLDHVTIRAIKPEENPDQAVWESLWASLTFKAL
jgi:uncharacterized GH25 family protein